MLFETKNVKLPNLLFVCAVSVGATLGVFCKIDDNQENAISLKSAENMILNSTKWLRRGKWKKSKKRQINLSEKFLIFRKYSCLKMNGDKVKQRNKRGFLHVIDSNK